MLPTVSTKITEETLKEIKKLEAKRDAYTHYGRFVANKRGWRPKDDWVEDVEGALRYSTEAAAASRAADAAIAAERKAIETTVPVSEVPRRVEQFNARWQERLIDAARRGVDSKVRMPTSEERQAAPIGWRKEPRAAYEAALEEYEADMKAKAEARREGRKVRTAHNGKYVSASDEFAEPAMPSSERLRVVDVPSLVDDANPLAFLDTAGVGGAHERARRIVDPIRFYEGPQATDVQQLASVTSIAALSASSSEHLIDTGAVPLLCNLVLTGGGGQLGTLASVALRNLRADGEAARYGVGGPRMDTPILQEREREAKDAAAKAQGEVGAATARVGAARASLDAAQASVAASQAARDAVDERDVDSRQLAKELVLAAQILVDPLAKDLERQKELAEAASKAQEAAEAVAAAATAKRVSAATFRKPSIALWKECVDAGAVRPKLEGLRTQAETARNAATSAATMVTKLAEAKRAAEAAVDAATSETSKLQAEAVAAAAERKRARAETNAVAARDAADQAERKRDEAQAIVDKCVSVSSAPDPRTKLKLDAPAGGGRNDVARVPVAAVARPKPAAVGAAA